MPDDAIPTLGNQYELSDDRSDIRVRLVDYGATVTSIECKDKHGKIEDLLLGCPSPEDHLKPHPHFNCIVGRYSNRITNAQFTLDGQVYRLDANIPPHQLHGGRRGFANRLWKGRQLGNRVSFELISADGDAGFPGELQVVAEYQLEGSVLRLHMRAETDKPTPISLTAHHYFNLSGIQGSSLTDHSVAINADHYLPVSNNLTQLGRIAQVDDSPFDLRFLTPIQDRLSDSHPQIQLAGGFDHTLVLNANRMEKACEVVHSPSGRTLSIRTDQPGVQLYTCNTLDAEGKNGVRYGKHQGLCLETQQFPDAPNHCNYPNAILRPGQIWEATTEYEFDVTTD